MVHQIIVDEAVVVFVEEHCFKLGIHNWRIHSVLLISDILI